MIRSLDKLLRNGTFRTATALVLAFLLTAAVPVVLSPESLSFAAQAAEKEDKEPPFLDKVPPIDTTEAVLSGLILVFLIIMILSIRYIFRNHSCDKSEEIGRLVTVAIVVMGALFLITSGRGGQHIAPAFGLLGMIAGYLLGEARSRKESRTSEVDEKP